MPRTAPAPNMVPIPGMCPTMATAAGGGGTGGSGGDGPGDGSTNGPGTGGGTGDGFDGDGKGATSCGAGSGGGCPNPEHGSAGSVTAGDPVDAITGRVFTIAKTDLALSGPLPLRIERTYTSAAADRDRGLGHGWSHSLGWEIQVARNHLSILGADGTKVDLPIPAADAVTTLDHGLLDRIEGVYRIREHEGPTRYFKEIVPGSDVFQLTRVADAYGNAIELHYVPVTGDARGRLERITDSVAREIVVERAPSGRISGFSVRNPHTSSSYRFHQYEYDDAGDLVRVWDATGASHRYVYKDHHLVEETTPGGRTTHYAYDKRYRCVETWVTRGNETDAILDEGTSDKLADGTRAKGVLHVKIHRDGDYIEVVNSRDAKRYVANSQGKFDKAIYGGGAHTNKYDDWGRVIGYKDARGSEWTWERDRFGRVRKATNPLGEVMQYAYDERGALALVTNALGHTLRYESNQQGDVVLASDDEGPLLQYEYDARGNLTRAILPDGASTMMTYDAHCNRVSVREPNGGTRHIEYDFLGRVTRTFDELGGETRVTYDPMSRMIEITYPDGSARTFAYDNDGNMTRITYESGSTFTLHWGGYKEVYAVGRPDGTTARFRYDRECDMVRVINEKGEEHRFIRSPAGRIVEEITFDGRRLAYKVDSVGELTQLKSGYHTTSIEYDPAGRIVSRNFDDDVVESFEYDAVGRLVKAANNKVTCSFEYDRRGNMIRESQKYADEEHAIDRTFSVRGDATEIRTTLGHARSFQYDVMGQATSITLDGVSSSIEYGLDGLEKGRRLPDGAEVRLSRDKLGFITDRRVFSAAASRAMAEAAAEGLSLPSPRANVEQTYVRRNDGFILRTRDRDRGTVEFRYDPVNALVERIPSFARAEIFKQDGAGAADDGKGAKFAAGGRIVEHDGWEYKYDKHHRLIEKRRLGDRAQRWLYEWDGASNLSHVKAPDGTQITFVYDALARRVAKRVKSSSGRITETRFVWSGDELVHELRRKAERKGDPVIEERTYAHVPKTYELFAERRGEKADPKAWRFALLDERYAPEIFVDASGSIVEELALSAFGEPEKPLAADQTNARFAGHWFDPETGLHYNRYRYFDPATGRYMSPEPLGMEGGPRPFTYANQSPFEMFDPDGLEGMKCVVTGGGVEGKGFSASTPDENGKTKNSEKAYDELHPVVKPFVNPNERLEKARNGDRHPAACAEPRAISDYLYKYEAKHGPFDDTPEGKARLQNALSEMKIDTMQADNDRPRAPCRNCSQMFAKMQKAHGLPKPSQISEGHKSANGNGKKTNFTPPKEGQKGFKKHQVSG
ncbi:MAG: RHS repeat-associated core domain-containing protein [Polyangiaceae bacterium]